MILYLALIVSHLMVVDACISIFDSASGNCLSVSGSNLIVSSSNDSCVELTLQNDTSANTSAFWVYNTNGECAFVLNNTMAFASSGCVDSFVIVYVNDSVASVHLSSATNFCWKTNTQIVLEDNNCDSYQIVDVTCTSSSSSSSTTTAELSASTTESPVVSTVSISIGSSEVSDSSIAASSSAQTLRTTVQQTYVANPCQPVQFVPNQVVTTIGVSISSVGLSNPPGTSEFTDSVSISSVSYESTDGSSNSVSDFTSTSDLSNPTSVYTTASAAATDSWTVTSGHISDFQSTERQYETSSASSSSSLSETPSTSQASQSWEQSQSTAAATTTLCPTPPTYQWVPGIVQVTNATTQSTTSTTTVTLETTKKITRVNLTLTEILDLLGSNNDTEITSKLFFRSFPQVLPPYASYVGYVAIGFVVIILCTIFLLDTRTIINDIRLRKYGRTFKKKKREHAI